MRKLWSNICPGLSLNLREQIAELRSTKKGKSQKTFRVSEDLKSSYSSSWQPWSSDETRECSERKSPADWSNNIQKTSNKHQTKTSKHHKHIRNSVNGKKHRKHNRNNIRQTLIKNFKNQQNTSKNFETRLTHQKLPKTSKTSENHRNRQ